VILLLLYACLFIPQCIPKGIHSPQKGERKTKKTPATVNPGEVELSSAGEMCECDLEALHVTAEKPQRATCR
jgi:hypothetical protein